MDKRLLIPVLIGIAVVAVVVVFIVTGTRGAHLALIQSVLDGFSGIADFSEIVTG